MLLEALISILLFSLAVLGLLAVQGQSIQNEREANLRASAIFTANELIGRMWVNRANIASYAGTTTLSGLPGGTMSVDVSKLPAVTITVNWTPPGAAAARQFSITSTIRGN
ncbi:MAG: prepilin-type cleavage/methylation domain-containing protein [Proteobacteria bacterium]|nr:prepilin-type cleavage/methylation domain-containing protein [Pseudomonadota bacterium]